jgi:SRSO17 transposase
MWSDSSSKTSIGIVPWDHRPLVTVLVGQVTDRLGEPDGIIAFDPSSFPKRGTHSVGVKRQWCSHRGKVDNCQVGVFMGYVSRHDHALLDFRLSLPKGVGTKQATAPGMPRAA